MSESALHTDLILYGSFLVSAVGYLSLLVSSLCEFDIKKPRRSNLEGNFFYFGAHVWWLVKHSAKFYIRKPVH